ncbi:MAG: extradiol ring-cleavage dioxygenase [Alphaproteobacteria bacterium]
MGEILGIGTTHYPGLAADDAGLCGLWKFLMNAPLVDKKWQDRANWPDGMVEEVGNDDGLSAAARYRERMWENFRKQRAMIDEFEPDFIVIIADDQYENFKEDIIPPFCVYGLDDTFEQEVWATGIMSKRPNHWGEPYDTKITFHGHREGAKCIAAGALERGVAMPYAYKMLHSPTLAHGFNYTQLYLDLDRKGFPHPIVPLHVNCFGSSVISSGGFAAHLFEEQVPDGLPDPPAPNPALCYRVGEALAETLAESPYRAVIMASSSWSHGFLASNTGFVLPDFEADRQMLDRLKAADYAAFRDRSLAEVEGAGHQEMLNWHVLAGAMATLDRKPEILDYVETYIFQSDKCFAVFPPK